MSFRYSSTTGSFQLSSLAFKITWLGAIFMGGSGLVACSADPGSTFGSGGFSALGGGSSVGGGASGGSSSGGSSSGGSSSGGAAAGGASSGGSSASGGAGNGGTTSVGGGNGTGGGDASGGSGSGGGTGAPTFAEIAAIIELRCADAKCHDAVMPEHNMTLVNDEDLYATLTTKSIGPCQNSKLAVAGDSDASALVKLILGTECMEKGMPFKMPEMDEVTPDELQKIKDWIDAGAMM
jgi:hypothetical protein